MITKPKLWLAVSLITVFVCFALIIARPPLIGIDFKGGALLEVQTTQSSEQVTQIVSDSLQAAATVQATEGQSLLIRTIALSAPQHEQLLQALQAQDPSAQELRFETVGPTIGAELRQKAWVAVTLSLIVTVTYLAYEFRGSGGLVSSWKFGIAATVALIHDLLVVTAAFALLGWLYSAPIDALFVTAMLALGGYSVNDTIVLFNRLKQEWLATRSGNLVSLMDKAAKLTLIRSLNTSIPILLTLITLLIFGGSTIHWFIVALIIGTVTGAYSTIYVAPAWLWLLTRK